jgi:hypothetical protein
MLRLPVCHFVLDYQSGTLSFWTEDELPVHDAGDAVVVGEGMMIRGFESGFAHGRRIEGA